MPEIKVVKTQVEQQRNWVISYGCQRASKLSLLSGVSPRYLKHSTISMVDAGGVVGGVVDVK